MFSILVLVKLLFHYFLISLFLKRFACYLFTYFSCLFTLSVLFLLSNFSFISICNSLFTLISCLYTYSAVCLHKSVLFVYTIQVFFYIIQLFVYLIQLFVYIIQLFVYIIQLFFYIIQLFVYIIQLFIYTFQQISLECPTLDYFILPHLESQIKFLVANNNFLRKIFVKM